VLGEILERDRTARRDHELERRQRRAAEVEEVIVPADLCFGDAELESAAHNGERPSTATEQWLAAAWADVLGRSPFCAADSSSVASAVNALRSTLPFSVSGSVFRQ